MPTGYTCDVQNGKITDFAEFALKCARNFAPLISMRDEPMDAPIPELKPSTYHAEQLIEEEKKLFKLKSMSSDEIKIAYDSWFIKECKYILKLSQEKQVQKQRYEEMLKKVQAWRPPTKDHEGLKRFMIEQLTESIRFDCGNYDDYLKTPKPENYMKWHEQNIQTCEESINYHRKYDKEERERTASCNLWIKQLRNSLEKK